MRSIHGMRPNLASKFTLLSCVLVTILIFLVSKPPSTNRSSTTVKLEEVYVSPTARVLLNLYKHAINENPTTSKKFIIYRAIGNSLPPRHASNQTYQNLLYTLLHEPDLPNAEKRWYINRILDAREEARIVKLLITHRQSFFVDSIDWRRYKTLKPSIDNGDRVWSLRYATRFPKRVIRAWMRVLHDKILFVMHCNAARNKMLELGISAGAEFVLPGDGNIFFTRESWEEVISNVGDTGYYEVPMVRLARNSDLYSVDEREATEEPQIIFSATSTLRFDDSLPYGRAPKLDLLNTLSGMGLSQRVGWCARLADGSGVVMDANEREQNRYDGVERALSWADWHAFRIRSNGDGIDISDCAMDLSRWYPGEGLLQAPFKRFAEMRETEICNCSLAAIHELPLNGSRSMTEMEKVRMVILLDLLGKHPRMGCIQEKMGVVTTWCRWFVGRVEEWDAGWWVRERDVDGVLAAFVGVFMADFRFAMRLGIGLQMKENVVDVTPGEWVRCVERRIARRFGSL